jgi:hypothetical protein
MSQLELIPRLVLPATETPQSGAIISEDGLYRYILTRTWAPSLPTMVWCMLNPSVADAENDDPTIRKCRGFAEHLMFGGITIVNLYAYRATSPADMIAAHKRGIDIVGPENDAWLKHAFGTGLRRVTGGWGATRSYGKHRAHADMRINRIIAIAEQLDAKIMAIGVNESDGSPRHPLYTPYGTPVSEWKQRAA